jgi:hypothetical protein
LPERLVIIIQIQLFESWWLSDPDNLCSTKHVNLNNVPSWGNVDDEVPNPIKWFKKHSSSKSKLKSPIIAKKIISELDPESMRDNSRSFDKFYREISLSHKKWLKCVTSNS